MKETDFITKLRNQVIGIVIVACISGLGMNAIFIATINLRIKDLEGRLQKIEDKQDQYLLNCFKAKNKITPNF